jgi:CspA family cold shock protein
VDGVVVLGSVITDALSAVLLHRCSRTRPIQVPAGGVRPRSEEETGMASGTVKWLNTVRGVGLIAQHGDGPRMFVRFSAIGRGYRKLVEGEMGTFDIEQGPRGPQAANLIRR